MQTDTTYIAGIHSGLHRYPEADPLISFPGGYVSIALVLIGVLITLYGVFRCAQSHVEDGVVAVTGVAIGMLGFLILQSDSAVKVAAIATAVGVVLQFTFIGYNAISPITLRSALLQRTAQSVLFLTAVCALTIIAVVGLEALFPQASYTYNY